MVQPRRRAFLTEPGESLLTARHPHHPEELVVTRPNAWHQATGQDVREDVLTHPLVTIPLPLYLEPAGPPPAPGAYDPRRDFPDVPAAMMWHPLLWLPPRVAGRFAFTEDVIENDEEWALRVVIEVTETGMYEEETGTWMDVLSLVGLDCEDPVDAARIEAWQAGEPDPDLDTLPGQMHAIYDSVDPDWAVSQAAEAMHLVKQATWGRIADDLLRDFEYLQSPEPDWTAEDIAVEVRLLTALAPILLPDAPDPDTGDEHGLGEVWRGIESELAACNPSDPQALLSGPAGHTRHVLEGLHRWFYPVLTEHFLGLGQDPQYANSP